MKQFFEVATGPEELCAESEVRLTVEACELENFDETVCCGGDGR